MWWDTIVNAFTRERSINPCQMVFPRLRLRYFGLLLQSRSQNEVKLSGRWVEPSKREFPRKCCCSDLPQTCRGLGTPVHLDRPEIRQSEDTPRTTPGPSHNRPHTLRQPSQNGRCLPALRSGRVCNGRSPPPPSRAWRPRAPDEGRCRADPHCTHNGIGRHSRIDYRYFHAGIPTSRFGARDDQRARHCARQVAPLGHGGIRHAVEPSGRVDDDHFTTDDNDNDNVTTGRDAEAGDRDVAEGDHSDCCARTNAHDDTAGCTGCRPCR